MSTTPMNGSRDEPQPPEFLQSFYSLPLQSPLVGRPYVTLTYAQSLDARIAGVGGKQLILSGKESMVMTHWMRSMHDAILVGIGTALNDNPNLNTRHLPPRSIPYPQPRPIILDAELRFNPSCNLILNVEKGAPPPWIFASSAGLNQRGIEAFMFRKRVLESGGVKVIEVPLESQRGHSGGGPRLSLPAVLGELHNLGIKSLMVEGGRSVIWSFLSERDSGGRPLIDSLVVTVAPILVGVNGFELSAEASRAENKVPRLEHVETAVFGKDSVFGCRVLVG